MPRQHSLLFLRPHFSNPVITILTPITTMTPSTILTILPQDIETTTYAPMRDVSLTHSANQVAVQVVTAIQVQAIITLTTITVAATTLV